MSAALDAGTLLRGSLTSAQRKLARRFRSPLAWRLFALAKLPSLALWGVRVRELDAGRCRVTMPYGWRTQNPFRSTYFAAQCGAAELSTGTLALLHLAGEAPTSMLVTRVESTFLKKVDQTLEFVCEDGAAIRDAVAGTLADGEGRTLAVESRAYLPDGALAAEFRVTWSFKRRRRS